MMALALTATFTVVEVIGGLIMQSLALLSDAAHMFTGVTALAISLAAVCIGNSSNVILAVGSSSITPLMKAGDMSMLTDSFLSGGHPWASRS